MKKIIFFILMILTLTHLSWVDADESPVTTEDFLERIEAGHLTPADYTLYLDSLDNPDADSLNHFLKAYLYLENFQTKEAYDHFNRAYALLQESPQPILEVETLYYLAEIEVFSFNISKAIDHGLRLRQVAMAIDNPARIIDANFILAKGFRYYYDENEANKFLEEALTLAEATGDAYAKSIYYAEKGDAAIHIDGQASTAMAFYKQSLDHAPETVYDKFNRSPLQLPQRLMLYLQLYYYPETDILQALEAYIESLDPRDLYGHYDAYSLLGDYYSIYDYEKSLELYQMALAAYEAIDFIPNSRLTSYKLNIAIAAAHYGREDFQAAADTYYALLNEKGNYKSDSDLTSTLSSLENFKYDTLQSQVELFKDLNRANKERVALSNKLMVFYIVFIGILLLAIGIIVNENRKKTHVQKRLYTASVTDQLTNVYNRGKIIDIIESNLHPTNAVAILDVDDFKSINDTYGHLVGDDVLITITQLIEQSIRGSDQVGRYGGEEFLIYFDNVPVHELKEIGERIRLNIDQHPWSHPGLKTSVSIGISLCYSTVLDEVLETVDQLLYEAKRSGKNKVIYKDAPLS